MPSPQKKRVLEKTRKRQRRGIVYLVLALVLIAILGIGVYVYVSSVPPNMEYAKLNTSMGLIEIELYRGQTPQTVDNFVNLAKSGFYNNIVWHRVARGFVIQTGDPNSRGGLNNSTWGQGQGPNRVPFENVTSLHNLPGYLAMARVGQDYGSATSQFFINLADNTRVLDGKYAVFGKVIVGMDVVNAIGGVPVYSTASPPDGQPITNIFLTTITISDTA